MTVLQNHTMLSPKIMYITKQNILHKLTDLNRLVLSNATAVQKTDL